MRVEGIEFIKTRGELLADGESIGFEDCST